MRQIAVPPPVERVFLRAVLTAWQHLQVLWHMQAANVLAVERDNVVDVMGYAGLALDYNRSPVDFPDTGQVGPGWSSILEPGHVALFHIPPQRTIVVRPGTDAPGSGLRSVDRFACLALGTAPVERCAAFGELRERLGDTALCADLFKPAHKTCCSVHGEDFPVSDTLTLCCPPPLGSDFSPAPHASFCVWLKRRSRPILPAPFAIFHGSIL